MTSRSNWWKWALGKKRDRGVSAFALLLLLTQGLHSQTINPGGIVNVANYNRRLAAHSIAAVFGSDLANAECTATSIPLPRVLCGAFVRFSDAQGNFVDAPLYYVSPTQINFQVPISIGNLNFCIGQTCTVVLVDLQAPAIFEYVDTQGRTLPLIQHGADLSLVTPESPARNGEILVMYGTGMGLDFPTLDFPGDGQAGPFNPPVEFGSRRLIRIDGRIAPYDFAGLTPGLVGLAQFNFKVAEEFTSHTFPSGPVPLWVEGIAKSQTVSLYLE